MKVQAIWSSKANSDLKNIYERHANKEYIRKSITAIVASFNDLVFTEQYQGDEILGLPFRRFFYKNWKIVYKPLTKSIHVLRVFDTRQDPKAII